MGCWRRCYSEGQGQQPFRSGTMQRMKKGFSRPGTLQCHLFMTFGRNSQLFNQSYLMTVVELFGNTLFKLAFFEKPLSPTNMALFGQDLAVINTPNVFHNF